MPPLLRCYMHWCFMPGWVASDMLNSLNNIFRTADLFCGQEAFATTVHSTSFAWAVRRVALSDHFLIDTGCDRLCPRQRSSSLARTSARKVRSSKRRSMPPRTRASPESSSGGIRGTSGKLQVCVQTFCDVPPTASDSVTPESGRHAAAVREHGACRGTELEPQRPPAESAGARLVCLSPQPYRRGSSAQAGRRPPVGGRDGEQRPHGAYVTLR